MSPGIAAPLRRRAIRTTATRVTPYGASIAHSDWRRSAYSRGLGFRLMTAATAR